MKKLFITGATGFIGQKLIKRISGEYEITCFVREGSNLEEIKDFKVNFVYGDLMDRRSISLKDSDTVVHLATSHNQGKENENLIASKNLIEVCKEKKIKRFVFISSMAANRGQLDDYGRNKLEIESVIKNSGLNYIILRPSMIYSNQNLSLIGTSLRKFPFLIPIIGHGRYSLNPVHIEDVIDAINAAIKTKQSNKIYDVAGAESLSFNEIIKICKERFKINKLNIHIPIFLALFIFRVIPIISQEAIKGINEDTNADIGSLKKDLKINPRGFEEGIQNVNL